MPQQRADTAGLGAATGAFVLWGFLPLYFNAIGSQVTAWEILVHRVLWAVPLMAIVVVATHRGPQVRAIFANRRLLLTLCTSACVVTLNWGLFIWAVTHDHVLESSLGYYINPLLNVLLGFVFFRERLRRLQAVAVIIAALGVLIMIVGFGKVPWIALALAASFGTYGLIHKATPVDSICGVFVETIVLLPFALAWLVWMYVSHVAAFGLVDHRIDLLLFGCGAMTVVPLVLFTYGTQHLRLGTLGLVQYITPTMHFLTGVFLMGEAFNSWDAVTFACIWFGLGIYAADALRVQHREKMMFPAAG